MSKKPAIIRVICVIVLLALCAGILGACRKQPPEPPDNGESAATEEPSGSPGPSSSPGPPAAPGEGVDAFDDLMDELFVKWVTEDSVSLNFFLADPVSFGAEIPVPTFGDVTSRETILRDFQENRELSDRLDGFAYKDLNLEQQVVYDILTRNLDLISVLEKEEDYSYYIGSVRPLNGVQVQLPMLLAEYGLRTAEDIETYLRLLEDFRRYFDDLIRFERERSRRGFFTSDANVDKIIDHCESFLTDREDNLLIVVFNDRIDGFAGLSEGQREEFKQRNRALVLDNVLPSYKALLYAMRDLRGKGANQGGLCDLPGGAEYAAAYLGYITGSDKSPEEVDALLKERMSRTLRDLISLYNNNPSLAEKSGDGTLGQIKEESPEAYLLRLQNAISRDYPPIGPTRYVVNEVHTNLQEHVGPAFYLTPAIDRYDDNIIYINPSGISDDFSLFTTLAHEGFPGHLYQTVYYLQRSPHPIRKALSNTGYVEGWATYSEMESHYYAGLPESEAEMVQLSTLYDLLFISRIDLGVNALGWGFDEVASICEDMGITSRDTVATVYSAVTGNPLFYLPYSLGFIEVSMLREEAEESLSGEFELLEFHRFLLDFGSAPFSLIAMHMRDWIASGSAEAGSWAA